MRLRLRLDIAIICLTALACGGSPHPGRARSAQVDQTTRASTTTVLGVAGTGFEVGDLKTGATAFGNRSYVWTAIPPEFDGWKFTRTNGGEAAEITASATTGGFVYIATLGHPPETDSSTVGGWERIADKSLVYSDKKQTALDIYRRRITAGSPMTVPQNGWAGVIVLAPALTFKVTGEPRTEIALPAASDRPPCVIIDYLPASGRAFVGSPTIAILPDGSYVAAHDIFGPGAHGDNTLVFRSTDRGATWQQTAQLRGQTWSSLFVHRGALYVIGPDREFGRIVIRRSNDGGLTWTSPVDASTGVLTTARGNSTAPTPIVEYNSRLWRAFEVNPPGSRGRAFQAFVMSAPADSDLLRSDSWTRSSALPYVMRETGGNWLEGNAVLAPGGGIAAVYRISKDGLEKAALMNVSADGRAIDWDPHRDRIDFPGGGVKFTIRYDPVSRLYWSLVNKQREPDALRNILCLTSSPDLRHWKVEATLLEHPDKAKHAFQYVDWLFDGDDIIAVSRTSWNGDTFHNANYLTFHRISSFRTSQRSVR